MNEPLTTESLSIAALTLTRYERVEPVKSSGLGLGVPTDQDETRNDVFPLRSRADAGAVQSLRKGTNRQKRA